MAREPLILAGAPVLTMDPEQPEAEAVAFQHGRVMAVGDQAQVERAAGSEATIHHVDGGLILPGFVDAHTHAARLGETHFRADLSIADTKDEALQLLAARAERTPPGGWVIGWNWDETQWSDRDPITPEDLDTLSTEHPALARRVCGHRVIVNRAALDRIDFSPDVEGGDEVHGVLSEDAAYEAWEACAPTVDTCIKGLKIESMRLASLGITTVADTTWHREIELLTRGAREGWMRQRSGMYLAEELLDHAEAMRLGRLEAEGCSLLGVKMYTDGSVGARTAAVREPYADEPTTGRLLRDAKQVEAIATRATRLGLQLKAHAIGDRAIDAVLDGITSAGLTGEQRPRIEHAEMLDQGHLERMAEHGITAVMQPNFIGNWQGPGGLYESALGAERARAMNPIAAILEAGVPLAFSSDGMPYGPLYGIQCATEHPNPSQRITVDQALHAYTHGAAYALGLEDRLGMLKPGCLADAVILDRDPRSGGVEGTGVAATVIGGELIATG